MISNGVIRKAELEGFWEAPGQASDGEVPVAQWKKKFERWRNASAPVDVEEVENLLPRIFGERLRIAQGTSHRFQIDVSDLTDHPDFALGNLPVPVRGGQKVLPVYLRRAYQAAELLGLYPPSDDQGEKEEHADEDD